MTTCTNRFDGARPRFAGKRTLHTFTGILALFLATAIVPGYGQSLKETLKSSGRTAQSGKTAQSTAGAAEYRKGVAAVAAKDYETAAKAFKEAMDKGNPEAMVMYGTCLCDGKGVKRDAAEGKKLLKKAADAGNANAQSLYGAILSGEGKSDEAIRYLKKSADQGCVFGQFALVGAYGNKKEAMSQAARNETLEVLKKVAEHPLSTGKDFFDDFDALSPMLGAIMTGAGMDVKLPKGKQTVTNSLIVLGQATYGLACMAQENFAEAKKWIRKAGDNGLVQADDLLEALKKAEGDGAEKSASGSASSSAGGAADYKKGLAAYEKKKYGDAVKLFRSAADKGNTDAMILYGVCLDEGRGVEQDKEDSVRWLKKAADAGDANAQAFYGVDQIDKDNEKEGLKYLKKSADQGCMLGVFALGMFYMDKDGEESKAIGYLRKVADRPLTREKSALDYVDELLSILNDDDFGLELDDEDLTAANVMIVISQTMLGMAYMSGTGVEQDLDEARKWIRKAKKNGFSQADSILELIDQLEE